MAASKDHTPVLNDFDMYINDPQGTVDTSELNEPGDVPNDEVRAVRELPGCLNTAPDGAVREGAARRRIR